MREGHVCEFTGTIVIGANGTVAGPTSVTLPFPADPALDKYIGFAVCHDDSANNDWSAYAIIATFTDPNVLVIENGNGFINLNPSTPHTWAPGDLIRFQLTYFMEPAWV
jgi:hypothetical protein